MRDKRQESRVESRPAEQAPPLNGPRAGVAPTPDSRLLTPSRRGVTLVELMITIMIISILAAAVLGVAAVAGETAREAKTRNVVARLHTLLMEQYGTYASRRIKLQSSVVNSINALNANSAVKGRLRAEARLYALREMILMEVPDRWSDVLLNSVPSTPSSAVALSPVYLDVSYSTNGRTELANLYLRLYGRIAAATNKNSGNPNTKNDILANQSAECLYMIIMNACGDGEARTLFPESNIGDTDGDGAPEFVDAWGHPIEFLRWAPGFESDIQLNANELDNPPSPTTAAQAWSNAGATDHDAFDLFRAQPVAFRLVPLIYSRGRDEQAGLYNDAALVPWRPIPLPMLNLETNLTSNSPPYVTPSLNPYVMYSKYLGTDDGTKTSTDNIHNHLIGTR